MRPNEWESCENLPKHWRNITHPAYKLTIRYMVCYILLIEFNLNLHNRHIWMKVVDATKKKEKIAYMQERSVIQNAHSRRAIAIFQRCDSNMQSILKHTYLRGCLQSALKAATRHHHHHEAPVYMPVARRARLNWPRRPTDIYHTSGGSPPLWPQPISI